MVPFVVLIALFALFSVLGHFHLPAPFGWWTSLRLALSGMFLLTASAHWGKRRPDLIQMVPRVFSRPDFWALHNNLYEYAFYAAFRKSLNQLLVLPVVVTFRPNS